jgi:opacity protein-like surface antigen
MDSRSIATFGCRVLTLGLASHLLCGAVAAQAEEKPDYTRDGFYIGITGVYALQQSLKGHLSQQLDDEIGAFNFAVDEFNEQLLVEDPLTPPDRDYLGPILSYGLSIKEAIGINARGGYRFHPFFAAEIQLEYVAGFETEFTITNTVSSTPPDDEVSEILALRRNSHDFVTLTANGKLIIPTGRVQLYGLGGLGLFYNRSSNRLPVYIDDDRGIDEALIDHSFGDESGVSFVVRAGAGVDVYITERIVLNLEGAYVMPIGRVEHLDHLTLGLGLQYRF